MIAAISWDDNGFVTTVLDTQQTGPPQKRRFIDVRELRAHLDLLATRVGSRLACVVDSTNGMVDGGLLSAGFRVHRADPALLASAARSLLASVPPDVLAHAARDNPHALTRLALGTGSLTGRFEQVEADVAAASGDLEALTSASRSLSRGPVVRADGKPLVALTFDDGPHPPFTGEVLDILTRYDVRATFFCVGLHAHVHRDLVRRISDEGHEVGNHTWSHALLADLDENQTRAQLDRTDDAIEAAVRHATTQPLFRPPYGAITRDFLTWFRDDVPDRRMVLWDVEAFDWARPGAAVIADSVLAGVSPGSIVLLHDGGGDRSQTVEALPRILEGLLERGYATATITDLITA